MPLNSYQRFRLFNELTLYVEGLVALDDHNLTVTEHFDCLNYLYIVDTLSLVRLYVEVTVPLLPEVRTEVDGLLTCVVSIYYIIVVGTFRIPLDEIIVLHLDSFEAITCGEGNVNAVLTFYVRCCEQFVCREVR